MKKCPVCKTKLYDGDKQCCTCNYVFPAEMPVSRLCLAGFVCALIPVFFFIIHRVSGASFNRFTVIAGLIAIFASLVLSITGLIMGHYKKIGFGIAGVIVSVIVLVPWILVTAAVFLISNAKTDDSPSYYRETEPTTVATEWHPNHYGSEYNGNNFSVERVYDMDDPNACVLVNSFWNGDPQYSGIDIPYFVGKDNRSLTVVSLGSSDPRIGGFTIAIKPEEKDFFKKQSYLNSPKTGDIASDPSSFGVQQGRAYRYEEIVFKIKIDNNVKEVYIDSSGEVPGYLAVVNDDLSITFYRYYLFFECSEENEYLYSEEGVLYYKKSGERAPVDDIFYKTSGDIVPDETAEET